MTMTQGRIINTFLEECISCGACRSACPFLERFGTPDSIISSRSEDVFLCADCKACDVLCPSELSPSEALFALKQELIKTDTLSERIKNLLKSSYAFAMRGHSFPFSYYSFCETAFWPGCSLMGTRPDLVREIPRLLRERFGNAGLALDCCFDPLFHLGDTDGVTRASERIRERIRRRGIKRLVLGCTNCKKIFSLFMPEIETVHLISAIPDSGMIQSQNQKIKDGVYLHHPCPSFRFSDIRGKATELLSGFTTIYDELKIPSCCGLGGGSHALSGELSGRFSERIIQYAEERPIVTYCMGCKNKFLKNNRPAYHLLELITATAPLERQVSSARKWFNRFIFAMGQRMKNKRLILGILMVLVIALATYLRRSGYISPEFLLEFIKQHEILAPSLFILIYSIGPSVFLPSLPLTLGAGFLWGPFWGVVFSIIGATIGASIPFLLSRYILWNAVKERFSYARWEWLKEKVERHGWKAVAFTRIIPIFSYPVLNYLFGITPIPFLHYLWSTFVFMLPACIAYVALGSSMGELILRLNIRGLITGILIAAVALLLPFAIRPLLRAIKGEK